MSEVINAQMSTKKHISINELVSGDVTLSYECKNNDVDRYINFRGFSTSEFFLDLVNIRISDNKGKSLKNFEKSIGINFTKINLKFQEKIMPLETYTITLKYTIPSMVQKFDKIFFYKDLESFSSKKDEGIFQNVEIFITFQLPKLFSAYEFWKEIHVNAPMASKVYTKNGFKFIECHSCLSRGGSKENSFMFQERYNSKIISLCSFLIGIMVTQIGSFIADIVS